MKKHYLPFLTLFTFLISLSSYAQDPPINNSCVGAVFVESETECILQTFSTQFATEALPQGGLCAGIPDDDVYFLVTANAENLKIIVTGEGTFDAVIQFFTGNCGELNVNEDACMDNTGPGETEELQVNNLNLGQEYYIRVFDRGFIANQTDFNFTLCVVEEPPQTFSASNFPCIAAVVD
jgi:hypothetical protein